MAACMDSESEVEAAAHMALKDGLPQGAAQPVLDALLARNAAAEPEAAEKVPMTAELKTLVEHCLCRVAAQLATAAADAELPLMSYVGASGDKKRRSGGGYVHRLLELGLWLSYHSVAEPGMIFTLLEQLMEGAVLSDCQEIFSWVEGQKATLTTEALWRRGKLIMLRMCNDLLRRLSKASATVLCGRILIVLAHFFQLSERSALNLSSRTNTHDTALEEEEEEQQPAAAADAYATMEDGEDQGQAIDREFHQQFWSLQAMFQAPQQMLAKAAFVKFQTTLIKVLGVFESQKLRHGRSGNGLTALGDGEGGAESYCVKYLTSSKLLHLQLRDPAFRRHFLLQCLILMQYIKMPPKADMATGVGAEMKAALKKLEERIWELLETMPPLGKRFTATIRHIVEMEKNWVSWKRQSCPVFERTPKPVDLASEPVEAPKPKPKPPAKRRFAIPGLKPEKPAPPPREVTVHLGNAELDRLWSLEGNSESLSAASRDHVHTPQLVTFFAPVVEEANPDNGYEEEYKHKHDKVFCWKANRLITRRKLGVYSKWGGAQKDLDQALPTLMEDHPDISKTIQSFAKPPAAAATEGKEEPQAMAVDEKPSRKRPAEAAAA